MDILLRCPHCYGALRRLGKVYRCERGHSFDIARQGYANLLPVSRRHSRAPGDNREMLLARRRFLDQGFYDRLSDRLNGVAGADLVGAGGEGPVTILDAGTGEGFYLQRLQAHLDALGREREVWCYGVDVSKYGVQYATHRSKRAVWLVASVVDLPFQDDAFDLVLSIFAPLAAAEFRRVLRPTGKLIVVSPGPRHLYALRALLYQDIQPHEPARLSAALAADFAPLSESRVSDEIELETAEDVAALLTMTPYGWNIDRATHARLEQLPRLSTPIEAVIQVFGKRDASPAGPAAAFSSGADTGAGWGY